MQPIQSYKAAGLDPAITTRTIRGVNGMDVHVLEAKPDQEDPPLVLLLHGFPELAFSWRKLLVPIATLGYHVVAPDQRGFGRTTGWAGAYEDPLSPYCLLSLADDVEQLVVRLGHDRVHCVIGHDFGSPVAAWCALSRPQRFASVMMMSAPFGGPPPSAEVTMQKQKQMDRALRALSPPRLHYQRYYTTPQADRNMRSDPEALTRFLRAYYHYKSADWPYNQPHRLQGWEAGELAKMPGYYIMKHGDGMAETVAPHLPSAAQIDACGWMSEAELAVYVETFSRTGFQGGLQWYRATFDAGCLQAMSRYYGRQIDIPSGFLAGAQDWGIYQAPGALEAMQETVCTNMVMCDLIDGAGHWVQQEQPEETFRRIRDFLSGLT